MGCVTIDPITTNLDATVLEGAFKLLDCLETQLANTVGGPVCRACVYPGISVPMDYCSADGSCSGGGHGMAAVRVASIGFVQEQILNNNCLFKTGQLLVTYEMTALRCAHTIDRANGHVVLPTCDELNSDTAIQLDDAAAMRAAFKCCFMDPPEAGGCAPKVDSVGQWTARGPTGGCMGGQLQFTVVLNDCACQ